MITGMKLFRMTKRLTQQEIGKVLGLNQPLISCYENLHRPIPRERAEKIAQMLSVDVEQLQLRIK